MKTNVMYFIYVTEMNFFMTTIKFIIICCDKQSYEITCSCKELKKCNEIHKR